jgi:hypothetical protein
MQNYEVDKLMPNTTAKSIIENPLLIH